VKSSFIEQGYFYAKANDPTWLRFVVRVHGDEVTYIDHAGSGFCSKACIARWAGDGERLAMVKAIIQAGDDVRKISRKAKEYGIQIRELAPLHDDP